MLCAGLLEPYYSRDTNQIAKQIEAEMWVQALGAFPFWAVRKAVFWWQSAANPDRRKRPLFGDIEERAGIEMRPVTAARIYLGMPMRSRPESAREVVTPEKMAERRAAADELVRSFMARAAGPSKRAAEPVRLSAEEWERKMAAGGGEI